MDIFRGYDGLKEVEAVAHASTRYQDLSADEIRALYQLILERMDVVSKDDRRRWERKVLEWNEGVRKGKFRVTLADFVKG